MANTNEGHRERLRDRMMSEGLINFQDHEILELLLFQFLPRRDTNRLAHDLINKFGNFAGVLDAHPEQLMTVKGISKSTACNLAVLKEVWERYKKSRNQQIPLNKLSSIVQYANVIAHSYVEKVVVVYLDNSTNYIVSEEFTSDDTQFVSMDIKRIVTSAVRANAAGVMMFHNHVKGPCQPSAEDVAFTEKLFVTLANINIVLLEHIIFNMEQFYSFYEHRVLEKFAQTYNLTKHSRKLAIELPKLYD